MRSLSILSILASALLASALPSPQDHAHGAGDDGHAHPGGAATVGETLPANFFIEEDLTTTARTPGARIVDTKLGPYTLKPGEAKNFFKSVEMPCKNCYILAAQGTLEYKDGSVANIQSGAWLHHMVALRSQAGTPSIGSIACSGLLGGLTGGGSTGVMWSTGNERAVQRSNGNGKFGLKIGTTATQTMTFELMNESTQPGEYYLRFRYEVIDAAAAEGYKESQVVWLDVGGCRGSNVPAKPGKYVLESPDFTVKTAARLLDTAGHGHDGATHLEVLKNGEVICTSRMVYGRKPETREPAGSAHEGMLHISDAEICRDFGTVAVGDKLRVKAYYDADKYPQMVHGGELHPVMGIAVVLVTPL